MIPLWNNKEKNLKFCIRTNYCSRVKVKSGHFRQIKIEKVYYSQTQHERTIKRSCWLIRNE